jgi:putative DNA primase/helicase
MGIALKYLSEGQRASIARSLFKVTSEEKGKGEIHGLCPIHGESNPSFSYNYQKDSYNCFSCGASGDLIRLWTEVRGLSQTDGFKSFCEEYGIEHKQDDHHAGADHSSSHSRAGGNPENKTQGTPAPPELSHEQVVEQMNRAWEKFPALPAAFVASMERERGWSKQWIEMIDLRLETWRISKKGELYQVKEPVKIAIPIRDAAGKLINIRLYQPGVKEFKIISFGKTTGQSALFPQKPLYNDKIVLLTEGESDTICALSNGFNAITQTSKLIKWPPEHLSPFKGRDVVIAYDADKPGQKYARAAAEALTGVAKSVRMLLWPAFMGIDASGEIPEKHGQDLTDFFVRHGKSADDLQALIDSAAPWPPPPVEIPPDNVYVKSDNNVQVPATDPAAAGGTIEDTNDILQFFDHGANNRFSFRPRLLAERILAEDPLMTDPSTGLVYRWDGQYWQEHEENHLKKKAVLLLRNEAQKSRVEDAIFQAKMLSTMPSGRKINDRMEWLNLRSGMLNLSTFEIVPHDREFYFTQMLPIDFDPDSQRRCDTWLKYLETNIGTPEVIAQLQEFTGYCFVRHSRYEKALYLLGPGADGKSTYMKILRELVGPENCSAVSFSAIEDQFQRSAMYNRLVNLSAEIGAESMESQYFKKIVSGDTLQAAYKHVDSFEFDPYCKLVFAGNTLPRVRDNTDGYFRKLLIIKMKRQFLEDDKDRDPNLFDKLKAELSEIFYWGLCGLGRLVKQGHFTFADETRELMQDYRRLNNPVLCYVEEECIVGEGMEVPKKDLYADYSNYCKRNGYTAMNAANFFRELTSVFRNLKNYRPRKDNPDRLPYIQGIKLKVEA